MTSTALHQGSNASENVGTAAPLLVVVVNFCTPHLTMECVKSLVPARRAIDGLRAVVVENGSGDDSLSRLHAALGAPEYAGWTTLIDSGANLGFAGGCNRGWKQSPAAEFVLLLNSDARVNPKTLEYCVDKMRTEPDIGVLSCCVENEDGSIQNVTRRFPTPMRLFATSLGLPRRWPSRFAKMDTDEVDWDRSTIAQDVDWIAGVFLMVRGDLIARLGLLDDDFFFYGEDIEFCHRVARAGYRCHYDPAVRAVHAGSQSPSANDAGDLWRVRQLWNARYAVQKKCYGRLAATFVRGQDAVIWTYRVVKSRFKFGRKSLQHRRARAILGSAFRRSDSAGRRAAKAKDRSRLRVLFALPGLHRVERGAEIAFENLARHLSMRADCDVTLIGSGRADPRVPYRAERAPCVDRGRFGRFPRLPILRDEFRYEELTFTAGLLARYRPRQFDVTVTCSFPFVNWILRARGSTSSRPAHVYVTQNGDWAPRRTGSEYRSFSCDGLVCTNLEYFSRHESDWNCVVIPNGVDLDRFYPGPGDRSSFSLPDGVKIVLVVGSLTPNKRILEAVESVALLPDVHLAVAGSGPLRDELDRLGSERMPGRLHHLVVPNERMPDLYRSADALLHMSRTEPFGNIYVEALATGLPIVGDDNARTRWIVESEGTVVDTRDPRLVADAVRDACEDNEFDSRDRRRALAQRRFGWPVVAQQYAEFLRSVVESRRRRLHGPDREKTRASR